MKQNKRIPRLRFPDFENSGEWEEKRLGSLIEIKGRIGYRGYTTNDIVERGKGAISMSPSNIDDSLNLNFEKATYITWDKYNESPEIMLEDGFTVLVKTGSSYGKATIIKNLPKKATINPQLVVLKPKEINAFFLYLIITNHSIQSQISKTVVGGAIPTLSQESISNFVSFIPSKHEQQKIASILSSLDELITAETDKLAQLQTHKKGLMQNLFPQEGEKVPKLRFKEFENEGEWEKKRIKDFAKVTTGNKDTQDKNNDGKYPFFVRSQNIERINSYSYDGEAILTSGDGVGVGKNFHYINGKFDFHQRVYCLYDFDKQINGQFIFMYFSYHFYDRVMKLSAKNSVDSVRMSMVTEMPIFLPSLSEQQKIADTLSSLDKIITAQTTKIDLLKEHKKGLMQGLFPA